VYTTDALGGVYQYPAPGASSTYTVTYDNGVPYWLNATDGNATATGAQYPSSTMDTSGNLYVVWEDDCASNGTACHVDPNNDTVPPDIYLRKRDANGNWEATKRVSGTITQHDGPSHQPSVAIDEAGFIHIAWLDSGAFQNSDNLPNVVHRVMDPSTGNLSLPDFLPRPSGATEASLQIAGNTYSGSASAAHLVWARIGNANETVYYSKLTGGASVSTSAMFGTWSTPLLVTTDPNTQTAQHPTVAESPSNAAYVAWDETNTASANIQVKMVSVTSPTSPINPANITWVSDNATVGDSQQPFILVDQTNETYVFFVSTAQVGGASSSTSNVFLRQYDTGFVPNTANLGTSYQLVSNNTSTNDNCFFPHAFMRIVNGASDGSYIVTWQQRAAALNDDIYGRQAFPTSMGGGLANTAFSVIVDSGIADGAYPALDDTDSVYVVWFDNTTFGATNNVNPPYAGSPTYGVFFQYLGPQY